GPARPSITVYAWPARRLSRMAVASAEADAFVRPSGDGNATRIAIALKLLSYDGTWSDGPSPGSAPGSSGRRAWASGPAIATTREAATRRSQRSRIEGRLNMLTIDSGARNQ